jgi:hypothetical protein
MLAGKYDGDDGDVEARERAAGARTGARGRRARAVRHADVAARGRPGDHEGPATADLDAAPTPRATKILLVATLLVTAAALAVFLAGDERAGDPRFAAPFLVLFSALFLARVLGQVVVVLARPAWLPPARQWNLMPYPLLLPVQVAILGFMAAIGIAFFRGRGALAEPHPTLGATVVAFSFVYAGVMVVRYAVRMRRRPGERWFGGTIPIAFHLVLAAFLFVLGRYHAGG